MKAILKCGENGEIGETFDCFLVNKLFPHWFFTSLQNCPKLALLPPSSSPIITSTCQRGSFGRTGVTKCKYYVSELTRAVSLGSSVYPEDLSSDNLKSNTNESSLPLCILPSCLWLIYAENIKVKAITKDFPSHLKPPFSFCIQVSSPSDPIVALEHSHKFFLMRGGTYVPFSWVWMACDCLDQQSTGEVMLGDSWGLVMKGYAASSWSAGNSCSWSHRVRTLITLSPPYNEEVHITLRGPGEKIGRASCRERV